MRPHLLPLALLFLAFTAPSIAQKAEEGEVVVEVAEGAPLSVQCALSAHEHVQWRADGAAPAPDLRAEPERALPGAGTRVLASLRAEHARPHHAALYRCTPTAPPVRVRVLPAPPAPATAAAATLLRAGAGVAAPPGDEVTSPAPGAAPRSDLEEATGGDDVDAPKVEMLLYELGKALEFDCKLPDETAKFNYLWFKNGTRLSAGAAAGSEGGGGGGARAPALEQEGRKLVFRRAHEDEHGDYACVVGHSIAHRWRAEALSLARVPPNTNVVEGQKFSITCKLVGKPYRPVTWTYAPDESVNGTAIPLLNEAGGRFSTRDSTGGVPDGVLEARDAERADAGVYACVPAAGTAAASTLRVKDVYAALWPFLGICLEVFILCAIILVYEKRRTKPELDDSDADADAHAQ